MQKIGTKRILGALLAAVMLLGNVPMAAFAAEVEAVPAETVAVETTEPDETVAETIEPAETVPADIATEAAEETEPAETMPAVEIAVESDVMLTADEGISSGTPDGTPPVLNGITLSATTVTPDSTIEVIVDASDDVSGADYGWVYFYCEETQKELFCHVDAIKESYWIDGERYTEKYPDGKLHGTLEIDQYVETGTFKVQSVEIRDVAENYRYYSMWANPEYEPDRVLPDSVKSLSFNVIESDTPDGNPPVLNGITLSADSVTAPGILEVIVDASDDVSGASYGWVDFYCEETQKELHCSVRAAMEEYWDEDSHSWQQVKYPDGKLHGTLEIDQYVETGTFKVQRVEIRDVAENYRYYYSWANSEYEPDLVLPDSVKSLSFNVIESDTPDGNPPVLNGITLSADSVTAPGILEVIVDASDDVSGASYGWVDFYCEETQKTLICSVSAAMEEYWDEDSQSWQQVKYPDGKLHGTLNIDQYVETGTFFVNRVDIYDVADNWQGYYRRANPEYEPDRVLPDSVKSLQLYIFNTIPDVTTSVAKPGFIDEVKNAEDNAYIVADYSGDATLTEDAFEAIVGTDKTLDLASDGITWRFNGNDITEEIKPIDLNVEITRVENEGSASGEAIADQLSENPGVVMKFAENGVLPGKATIQVKVDYAMREYLGSDQNLCVYYYNNETGKLELVAEDLKVINDTYVEFSITHCSYYVLTQKLPEEHPYSLGDVNHDGKINAKDSTLILQYSVGVLKDTSKFCETCANVNGDSKLNAKDATMILQYSVGLRTDF